jgi:hypothetical protein
MNEQTFSVNDVIRLPKYRTRLGYRCWKIQGVHLGGVEQESTYELIPLDILDFYPIQIPCIILDTHPNITKI